MCRSEAARRVDNAVALIMRSLRRIVDWLREHRHERIAQQHRTLTSKLRGHYAYYGIRHNSDALRRLRDKVSRAAWPLSPEKGDASFMVAARPALVRRRGVRG